MQKSLLTLFLLLATTAAVAAFEPVYNYGSIYVVNDSDQALTGVTVVDTRHGREHSCGDIAPMGTCQVWFGERRYQDNTLRMSWGQGGSAQSEDLKLDVPITLATGPTLRGIITVGADGSLSTSADQPGRR